jgi:hypothetical protein
VGTPLRYVGLDGDREARNAVGVGLERGADGAADSQVGADVLAVINTANAQAGTLFGQVAPAAMQTVDVPVSAGRWVMATVPDGQPFGAGVVGSAVPVTGPVMRSGEGGAVGLGLPSVC